MRMTPIRAALLLAGCLACSRPGPVLPPNPGVCKDAILVLPGFGYDSKGRDSMARFAANVHSKGYLVFTADYLRKESLSASRESIRNFIYQQRLHECERLHVLAFIAGAWSLNPLLSEMKLANLKTVIYDRSPLQERAPRVVTEEIPVIVRQMFGAVIFELARTPYPRYEPGSVRTGLIVETKATSLMRFFKEEALAFGPVQFDFASFQQKHDDAVYWPFNHTQMYDRFEELEPLLLAFIELGRFPENSNRTEPGDPFER